MQVKGQNNKALTEVSPSDISIILWIIQEGKSNIYFILFFYLYIFLISEFGFCMIFENWSPQTQIVSEKVLFKNSNFVNNVGNIT